MVVAHERAQVCVQLIVLRPTPGVCGTTADQPRDK